MREVSGPFLATPLPKKFGIKSIRDLVVAAFSFHDFLIENDKIAHERN
jgi:hypothetical protein